MGYLKVTEKKKEKQKKRGDPDLLTIQPLGFEKVASLNLSSSSPSRCESSVTDSFHESVTSFFYSGACAGGVAFQGGVFATLFSDFLACFLAPEFPDETRTPTNASESIQIQLRCLRMHYGRVKN